MEPDGAGRPAPESNVPSPPAAHPVDVHVGARLRLARTLKGCSQEDLGQVIGVTAQQIQKYEVGTNRISASALFRLCGFLGRPVDWLFDGLEATGPRPGERADVLAALMASREGAQMALSMAKLTPAMRRKVLAVVRAFLPDDLAGDLGGVV
jgi:transcriptional regulator with XRE-family HTH domain